MGQGTWGEGWWNNGWRGGVKFFQFVFFWRVFHWWLWVPAWPSACSHETGPPSIGERRKRKEQGGRGSQIMTQRCNRSTGRYAKWRNGKDSFQKGTQGGLLGLAGAMVANLPTGKPSLISLLALLSLLKKMMMGWQTCRPLTEEINGLVMSSKSWNTTVALNQRHTSCWQVSHRSPC